MENLAKFNGFSDLKELYSYEVSTIMKSMFDSNPYLQWNRGSRDRHKFDVMVRNCGLGVSSRSVFTMQTIL